jgi:cytochrome c peroxidase
MTPPQFGLAHNDGRRGFMPPTGRTLSWLVFLVVFLLVFCTPLGIANAGAQGSDIALTRVEAYARAAQLEALGRELFFDPALSASGRMACAACHDPDRAFGPPNALAVQLGGKDMRQPGIRTVPSLKYLQAVPQFTAHYYESDDEGDDSIDNGPTGGLTWDGRVDRDRDQARIPLLSPFEMANAGPADVVAAVRNARYAGDLRKLFGANAFADTDKAFAGIAEALEVFQQDFREFYPYSSKYDAYLAGRVALSEQEARGLALFNDPAKGNCGNCHRSQRGKDGTPPQFTDYGLIAIGVPRNRAIPANADASFFDLGACGPLRTDLAGRSDYCGRFVTPTLRNVALRQSFFHNGLVHTLRQAVEFYVERDTDPGQWYPRDGAGRIEKFDDLPEPYRGNVNREPPFGGEPGKPPVLSPSEIDDVIAFLDTLTDGYKPKQ